MANPFIEKAKRARRDRQRALLMSHLRPLQALLARYDGEPPSEARERIAQRVEECKRGLSAC